MDKYSQKLIKEINNTVVAKKWNMEHGTATQTEISIVKDALGYLSLLRFSCLSSRQVYELWSKTNLAYM